MLDLLHVWQRSRTSTPHDCVRDMRTNLIDRSKTNCSWSWWTSSEIVHQLLLQSVFVYYFDHFPQYISKIGNKHLTVNGRKLTSNVGWAHRAPAARVSSTIRVYFNFHQCYTIDEKQALCTHTLWVYWSKVCTIQNLFFITQLSSTRIPNELTQVDVHNRHLLIIRCHHMILPLHLPWRHRLLSLTCLWRVVISDHKNPVEMKRIADSGNHLVEGFYTLVRRWNREGWR